MDIWHPFTQHGLGDAIPEVILGQDALLHTADGRALIDGISSWWVNTHGHCNRRIADAMAAQAAQLDQIIFAGWSHPPAQQLTKALGDFLPGDFSHAFYSDSGSTAVEVALKMALGHWYHRGIDRQRIIVMQHSYHGDTIGTMSVGERGVFNAPYQPLLFDVATLPFPEAGAEQTALDALEALCRDGDHPPAAFILEPLVLGAGGMKFYSPETLAAMAAICARHDVPLIADEVMTGWGRTGTLTACEQAGITPDIACFSKGLTAGAVPLAVTLCKQPFFDAHYAPDRAQMFFHSSSYTANPLACAAALENIAIWRDEPVQQRIDHIAARHADAIDRLEALPHIANIRQCGTILAMEIVRPTAAKARTADSHDDNMTDGYMSSLGTGLARYFIRRDVLLRPLGDTIYVMPPYCISDAQLERIYDAIAECDAIFV